MAQTIKLMADYDCWPLWWAGEHDPGNIDPATLPLSSQTLARLERWSDTFDTTLNLSDPCASGFPTPAALAAFEQEGAALWLQLRTDWPQITSCSTKRRNGARPWPIRLN